MADRTKSPWPVRPIEPASLISFMTKAKMDKKTISRISKALIKYHEACVKAAKTLNSDFKDISKMSVKIKTPTSKK